MAVDGTVHFVSEDVVRELLTMELALDAVTAIVHDQAKGLAQNLPRTRIGVAGAGLNMLAASWSARGVYGQKIYSVGPGGSQFWLMLFHADGRPYAILEAQKLGQVRTGAATGVATAAMAKTSASRLGVIGTGYQMQTQVEAVCKALDIRSVKVWSPTERKRAEFAELMTSRLGGELQIDAVNSAEEATADVDIVNVLTTAKTPVLRGCHVTSGMHINAAGSNVASSQEIDVDVVAKATRVVTDDLEQARVESGDLMAAVEAGKLTWEQVERLDRVVAEDSRERPSNEVSLFKSLGIGLWDVAVAAVVIELAIKENLTVPANIASGADMAAPARFHGR